MSAEQRIAIVIGLIALATLAGLIWRVRTGRARQVSGDGIVDLTELAVIKNGSLAKKFGRQATFVQFSSEFCSSCAQTAKLLQEVERSNPGVLHLEVDITNRLELAKKYSILQTPTTLVLDSKGRIKSRIGGSTKPQVIQQELAKQGSFEI
jgi:thiol-disulfide isomerase/thioredoxin